MCYEAERIGLAGQCRVAKMLCLETLMRKVFECSDYQTVPIILLHESYPYCQFGAYLAPIYPNVYFDLSYAIPFVDKLEMVAFTRDTPQGLKSRSF